MLSTRLHIFRGVNAESENDSEMFSVLKKVDVKRRKTGKVLRVFMLHKNPYYTSLLIINAHDHDRHHVAELNEQNAEWTFFCLFVFCRIYLDQKSPTATTERVRERWFDCCHTVLLMSRDGPGSTGDGLWQISGIRSSKLGGGGVEGGRGAASLQLKVMEQFMVSVPVHLRIFISRVSESCDVWCHLFFCH